MTTLATLQAALEELKRARRTGARSVAYDGKSVSYGTPAEMAAAQYAIEAEIAALQGATKPRNVVLRSPRDRGW